jgi:alpha-amylase
MGNVVFSLLSMTGVLGLVMACLSPLNPPTAPQASSDTLLRDSTESTTLVHLFEWTWNDIAAECENHLGPNGFKGVQISPPQEHIVLPDYGFPWWQRYQPVSYQLESRSGSRTELAAMIQRCNAVGVEVYADAVINHMAGFEAGLGSAGTEFTKYEYPSLYGWDNFNNCRQPITDYGDAENVTQCELVGLADLDTSSEQVQATIVAYLSELVELGIGGFRIDAAKHIRAHELGQILERLRAAHPDRDLKIYQEVIDPGTEAIRKKEYYPYGQVLDFEYGRLVSEAFLGKRGQTLAGLKTLEDSWDLAPDELAVVFIDNHDKQRGHGGGGHYLTHQHEELYALANVFMLAFPYGQPKLMSSYGFEDSEQGPPAAADGTTQPVYQGGTTQCTEGWICEHRWRAMTAMVGFRNVTQSVAEVTDWWSNGANQIAFGRGDRGFVVINNEAAPLTRTFTTQLPQGQYCNVIQGALVSVDGGFTPCADGSTLVTVDGRGRFKATVLGGEALALHVGARR